MKIGIVGLGSIGSRVAKNLVAGGQSVIVAVDDLEKAKSFAAGLGGKATARPVADAIRESDVIVLAVWFDVIKKLLEEHRQSFAGKVIVDPSNPIGPDGKGGFRKTIPDDQSSGTLISGLLPQGSELVKAFGTVKAESLETGANRKPQKAVLFYATDFPEAGNAVERMIEASGFTPVKVGGINQSIRIEVFGDLHESGKLGRLVDAEEAKTLI